MDRNHPFDPHLPLFYGSETRFPQVMAFFFQTVNEILKGGVSVKITREKEGGAYVCCFQALRNKRSPFGKLMAGENERDRFPGTVAADDGPLVYRLAPVRGGAFFVAAASCAASR